MGSLSVAPGAVQALPTQKLLRDAGSEERVALLCVGYGVRAHAHMPNSPHHTKTKGNLPVAIEAFRMIVIICLERFL